MKKMVLLVVLLGCSSSHEVLPLDDNGNPIPEFGCPSTLVSDNPAPFVGYCPTGTGRSDRLLPSATPTEVWQLDLPSSFRPSALLIDGQGRLYLQGAGKVVAVDDLGGEGQFAWQAGTAGFVQNVQLQQDGRVFVRESSGAGPSTSAHITDNGLVEGRGDLPSGVTQVVQFEDMLIAELQFENSHELVGLDSVGNEVWRHTLSSGADNPAVPFPMVVDHQQVVAATGLTTLVSLDARTGQRRWSNTLPHRLWVGPAIHDGTVYAGTGDEEDLTQNALVLVDGNGALSAVELEFPPENGQLVVAADGSVFFDGNERSAWVGLDGEVIPMLGNTLFADAANRVLLSERAPTSLKLVCVLAGETSPLWSIDQDIVSEHGVTLGDDGRFYMFGTTNMGQGFVKAFN